MNFGTKNSQFYALCNQQDFIQKCSAWNNLNFEYMESLSKELSNIYGSKCCNIPSLNTIFQWNLYTLDLVFGFPPPGDRFNCGEVFGGKGVGG